MGTRGGSPSSTTLKIYNLYIALFARPSFPGTYHWALLICAADSPPTATEGVRYHVTNSIQAPTLQNPSPPLPDSRGRVPWRFESQPLASLFSASPLLARVLISPLADPADAAAALGAVPLIQGDQRWTCRIWVRDALAHLIQRGLIRLPSHLSSPTPVEHTPDGGRLSLTDDVWAAIETACLAYLKEKHALHRWRDAGEGRWVDGQLPTWDLTAERELVA